VPGGRRDVLRGADFNDGQTQGFYVDSGAWTVSGGALAVSAESLRQDAAAVFYVDDYLPIYYEIAASVSVAKPTAGWKANAYLIFDYFSPDRLQVRGHRHLHQRDRHGHPGRERVEHRRADAAHDARQHLVPDPAVGQRHHRDAHGGRSVAFTHTVPPRGSSTGALRPEQGHGRHGLGQQPRPYDNVRVQILPPQVTLDSRPPDLTVRARPAHEPGGGLLAAERQRPDGCAGAAAPAVVEAALPDGGPAWPSTSWLQLTTVLRTSGVAGIAFDVYDDDDFKFAVIDVPGQRVYVGHVSPRGGWVVNNVVSQALTAGAPTRSTSRSRARASA
jgi:hypothetical protein